MANEDIRRYSLDEIRQMNERGDLSPPADAPTFEGDEEFWAMVERGVGAKDDGVIHLSLSPEALDYFRRSGPDYLKRMADVLEGEAKKAS